MTFKNERTKIMILLQLLIAVFSLVAVFSKFAAQQKLFSFMFFVYYGLVLFILFIYAICWQQIIKKLPLTVAYASKAVTVVWGLVWGKLLFNEAITTGKIIGSVIIIAGIIGYVTSDKSTEGEDNAND